MYGSTIEMSEMLILPRLRVGVVHPQVADFRIALENAYPEGGIPDLTSETFDPALQAILIRFQTERGIPSTGVTDVATWAAIRGVSPEQITLYDLPSPSGGGKGLLLVALAAAAAWALS